MDVICSLNYGVGGLNQHPFQTSTHKQRALILVMSIRARSFSFQPRWLMAASTLHSPTLSHLVSFLLNPIPSNHTNHCFYRSKVMLWCLQSIALVWLE